MERLLPLLASVITQLVKEKSLKDTKKISKNVIVKVFSELLSVKIHCSVLADKGLKNHRKLST